MKSFPRDPGPGRDRGGLGAEDEHSAAIGALIHKAEELYEQRRYREAIALCKELIPRGHSVAVMTMIREGCENALRRRRTLRVGLGLVLVLIPLAATLLYLDLARVRLAPPPGTVRVRERQEQAFSVSTRLGRHRLLEYTWELLGPDGAPADAREQRCLTPRDKAPWACTFHPLDDFVRAADRVQSLTRRVVVRGVNTSGTQVIGAEWLVEVANVPRPPEIHHLSVEPPTHGPVAIPSREPRIFRVDATDGDGGKALRIEWLVAEDGTPVAKGPTWTYTPDYPALAKGRPGHAPGSPVLHPVLCRVSNAFGEPMTETLKWNVRVVASNAAPQILEVLPDLPTAPTPARIREGVPIALTAFIHDPDKDDALKIQWDLDGRARWDWNTPTWKYLFPTDTTDREKEFRLRLTVTDACGAKAERTWRLIVVNAGE